MLQQSFLRIGVLVEECGTTLVRYRIDNRWNATVSGRGVVGFVIVRDLAVQGSERSWVRNLTTQAVFKMGEMLLSWDARLRRRERILGS